MDQARQATCEHIELVKAEQSSESQSIIPITLEPSKLEQLPIPPKYRNEMETMFHQSPNLVQRVATETFAVQCTQRTQDQPLGIVHVHFQKSALSHKNKSGHIPFCCPCNSFKEYN